MSATAQNDSALVRRLRYAIAALSLLLIAVVANSLFHSEENPLNPIAAAAERTQEEPGARFTMSVVYNSASLPRPMTARGHGAYNSESGLSEAALTIDSPTEGRVTVDSIADDTSFYIGGGMFSGKLPEGKTWLKVEPFLGHSQEELMLSGSGADSSFQALSSVDGHPVRLGGEKVGGVPTQHYRAEVSYDAYASLLRDEGKDEIADQLAKYGTMVTTPPTVEAWIDAKGVLRRMRMIMTMPAPGQAPVTMDMQMNLFDIGAHPPIVAPDSASVFDATPLLEGELDSIEG